MSKSKQTVELLGTAPIGKTLAKFAVPAIISNLITSIYNITDQIFIGQNVGILGNAATNVAFPISIICTAVAILFGFGGAASLNLEMGRGNQEKGFKIVGTTFGCLILSGIIISLIIGVFLEPMLWCLVSHRVLSLCSALTTVLKTMTVCERLSTILLLCHLFFPVQHSCAFRYFRKLSLSCSVQKMTLFIMNLP